MASRLSQESLVSLYDQGHYGISRVTSGVPLVPELDLDAILALPDAKKKIRALAPQKLYSAIMQKGLENSVEVLALISPDQLIRIFDYDVWREDQLSTRQAMRWLRLYNELGPKAMCQRYRQLDEEYQIALIAPYVRCYTPEDYEKMSDQQQDSLCRFPGDAMYYAISTDDKELFQGIEDLVQSGMALDMNYIMSLLWHGSLMPPLEQESLLSQFRRARLEEDGFLTFEESLEVFRPLSQNPIDDELVESEGEGQLVPSDHQQRLFLDQVIIALKDDEARQKCEHGFLYLANALCAVAKIEADDLVGLRTILDHGRSIASLGLEIIAQGDVHRGLELIKTEAPRTLFRIGLGPIHKLRLQVVQALENTQPAIGAKIRTYYQRSQHGLLLLTLDTAVLPILGFEQTEIFKGLFNRFPLYPQSIEAGKRVQFQSIANRHCLNFLKQCLAGIIVTLKQESGEKQ